MGMKPDNEIEDFYTNLTTSVGYKLTQSVNGADPDAMMSHEFRTRLSEIGTSEKIAVTHHLSGPFTFLLTYSLTVANAWTMATYLQNAARIVENYNRGLDPEEPDDWGFDDVTVTGIYSQFKNCLSVDLDQGHVELFHVFVAQDQPMLCHNLKTEESRELASYFNAAADDMAHQLTGVKDTAMAD